MKNNKPTILPINICVFLSIVSLTLFLISHKSKITVDKFINLNEFKFPISY